MSNPYLRALVAYIQVLVAHLKVLIEPCPRNAAFIEMLIIGVLLYDYVSPRTMASAYWK